MSIRALVPIAMVPRCRFLHPVFSAGRVQHISDLHSTFALRPHHVWCGLSANVECRSEMCCTWLAESTGRKNDAINRHLNTIPQFCRTISSQLRHVSTIGKKLLSSDISSTCPYNMVNFGLLAAEIISGVWGTPAVSYTHLTLPTNREV